LSGNNSGLSITYDGIDFIVSDITGVVMANNMTISDGDTITGSVVIVLGGPGTYRISITADLSHPEVIP
jgi:serine/threonine-protein kinase